MANFVYAGTVGNVSPEVRTFDVAAGSAASITQGDLVVIANGFAAKVANGGGTTGGLYGHALTTSTDTASAAGTVTVLYSPSGLLLEGTATTPANLAAAVLFDKVTIDVSSGTQTVDENDTTNGGMLLYKFVGTDYATTGKCQIVVPFNVY